MEAGRPDGLLQAYTSRLLTGWPAGGDGRRTVDGSLALVDISGFTSLTEMLARRGKVGAEEMSDILSGCFADLLGVARPYGPDLVKWGGDAVLLLFDGPAHPTRAALAALAMQDAIGRVGRVRSSGGATRLRMSVGIHSGRFQFFLAGFRPVDVIPAGRDVTLTASLQAGAQPGEVAVSGATAAQLPPALLGPSRGEAVILRRAEVTEPGGPEPVPAPVVDLRRFLAQPVAEHLLSEHHEPEHRRVAVAFLEFGGTDHLLAEHGAGRLRGALAESIEAVQEACLRHRVTYLESDIAQGGVKVLLVAGAPVGAGGEEERLLRAVSAIMAGDLPLPARAGLTTGRVFTGDFGPAWRRTYSIKGDAVNLAARILGRARPGQLLASEEVLERSQERYEATALEPFFVKGKQQPVRAVAVGARLEAARDPSERTALVGRERELAALGGALQAAAAGRGSVLTLLGEPGLGKSRLVDELVDRAAPARVVRAACSEYETAAPYRPFRTLLRGLLGVAEQAGGAEAGERLARVVAEIAPDLVPWLPLLAVPVDAQVDPTPETDSLDARFRTERMLEVTRLLLAALLSHPTLLIFEDVHLMDAASRGLLAELARVAAALPWLLLVTQRGEQGLVGDRASWLRLEPLDTTEALFLAESAGIRLGVHELKALAERAGGNPLFLSRLLAAAGAAGGMVELPDSVESLLTAQIDGLAPADRRLLRYAAVLGTSFELDLLEATLKGRLEVTPGTWTRLREFLSVDGRGARFRHALVRDAAYEGLPYSRRRELHGAVGDTIARTAAEGPEAVAGALSLHFLYAERFDLAWRYAGIAARQATAAYAHVDAKALYGRALRAARRLRGLAPSEVAAAWEGLGNAHVRLGEFDKARKAFQVARRRLREEPARAAELMLQEAQAWHWLGSHRQAMRVADRALALLEESGRRGEATTRVRLLVLRAVVLLVLGRTSAAIESCRAAVAEAEAIGDRASLAYAYDIHDSALIQMGRYDEAVHRRKALALLEELGELDQLGRALNNLGVAAHVEGKWPEALELYARAIDSWKRAGNYFHAAVPTDNTGLILLHQGRLDDAEPLFQDALRVARAARSRHGEAPTLMNLGMLAVRRGDLAAAEELLLAARAAFTEVGRTLWVHMTDARVAELRLAQGRATEALELASQILAQVSGGEELFSLKATLLRVHGIALRRLGRHAEAQESLAAALAEARLKRDGYEVALALRELGSASEELEALLGRLGVVELPDLAQEVPA